MNYTDGQLKQALAKMLPEKCYMNKDGGALYHQPDSNGYPIQPSRILDTELFHLCWLVEDNLTEKEYYFYADVVLDLSLEIVTKRRWFWLAMPWQQRVEALAKAKGVEI